MSQFKAATWPVQSRMTAGTLHYKNLYSNTFAYTETQKVVSAGSSTAIHSGIAGLTTEQTVTTGLTDPDVPRVLTVTPTGTTADVSPSTVRVTGTNIEGKVIVDNFTFTANQSTAVTGTKAFRTVTSVEVEAQDGTGVTYTIGTGNALGVNHRLFNQNTTVKVYSATTVGGSLTKQSAPTVAADEVDVELNTVTPAVTPDSTTFLAICYAYDNWSDGSVVYDSPEYYTSTSTSSTSTSTSTTTITTSTSSTSVSTSSTSVSTSSTSSSTSSTSTSTTTAP